MKNPSQKISAVIGVCALSASAVLFAAQSAQAAEPLVVRSAVAPANYVLEAVYGAPQFIVQPVQPDGNLTGVYSLTVEVVGVPEPVVSWESSYDDGATWAPVKGEVFESVSADGKTLTITPRLAVHNGKPLRENESLELHYRAVAVNENGSAVSQTARVTVLGTRANNVGPCGDSPYQVFTDVPLTHKFYHEIDWMYCQKVSTGVKAASGLEYRPAASLTREAMAAFMYRLAGSPSVDVSQGSPFADVKPGDAFYKEVVWMSQAKLSTGIAQPVGKPFYAPKRTLSREAMAAFMYRLAGSPSVDVSQPSPFGDVAPGDAFYKEVVWMSQAKLSTGIARSAGKPFYAPKSSLSREAMAAFLYRANR